MIPLSYFLIAWVVLLAIFGVMALLTLIQMLRHGLATFWTYATTFIFLVVTAGVLLWVTVYIANADWSAHIQAVPTDFLRSEDPIL